jgi:hypothetical protein
MPTTTVHGRVLLLYLSRHAQSRRNEGSTTFTTSATDAPRKALATSTTPRERATILAKWQWNRHLGTDIVEQKSWVANVEDAFRNNLEVGFGISWPVQTKQVILSLLLRRKQKYG